MFDYDNDGDEDIYAANGWSTTASMGAVTMMWLIAVNISELTSRQRLHTVVRERGPAPF